MDTEKQVNLRYAFFVMLRASTAWLRLAREQRRLLVDEHLRPLLDERAALKMRYFDAEAFTADCSDLMLIETADPKDYYFFIERLRDTPLISASYFEIVRIIPAIEQGFVAYEASLSQA